MSPCRTKWLRRGIGALVALGLGWMAVQAVWPNHVRDPNPTEIRETMQTMQNYCLGRFLVPLPRGSQVKIATSSVDANFWFKQKLSRFEFDQIVEKRWLELQQLTHDSNRDVYISPSTRSSPMEGAAIFTYKHTRLTYGGPEFEGKEIYRTEGYLWRDSSMFYFEPTQNAETEITATMRSLQVREFDAVPAEAGLCAAGSFFPGPGTTRTGEAVRFSIDIPGNPTMLAQFRTNTLYSIEQIPGRTPGKPNYAAFNNEEFQGKVLRDRSRMVLGLTGEEYIAAATSKRGDKYRTSISARWHFPGEVGSIIKPTINIGLGASYDSETEPSRWAHFPKTVESGGDPEAHFMAIWTAILDGAQLR